MGRTQKLAAIIKEGVRNPQKIKKGLKVLKNQGPEIFKQRLSASVNYEPGYGRVKKEKLKNYSGEILFSIVMPVYNVEIKWLDKAIESIEKQNYKNWEICIADDCSTRQEVREHLSAMKNSRIKIKLLEKNQGISGATNAAAALASGGNEMLQKLKQKLPEAKVVQADIIKYSPREKFDYIFISSGSVSLFTDTDLCKQILCRIKEWLSPMGRFVFAVDTIANRCTDDNDYAIAVSVKTKENFELVLKSKNHYDEQSQTQLSPGIYEMYSDTKLIQSEFMDFQTHLYKYGEMEEYLKEVGFTQVKTYSSFDKEIAINDRCEMFLFECSL